MLGELQLKPFSVGAVIAGVKSKRPGHIEPETHKGRHPLIGYDRPLSLGWLFVVRAELSKVLSE